MSTIVTRAGKGSPLTNTELDSNFTNLNTDKLELSGGSLTGNLNLGDNVKAQFGAGDDLEIFSNGSTALLKAGNATSDIRIESDNRIVIADRGFNEAFAVFNDDSDVKLYHNGSLKIATTATGADITGVLTADGLTVDAVALNTTLKTWHSNTDAVQFQSGSLWNYSTSQLNLGQNEYYNGAYKYLTTGFATTYSQASGGHYFKTASSGSADATITWRNTLQIANNGDISFYNDSAAQGLFWDSSASSFGLGTTSVNAKLHVSDATAPTFRLSQTGTGQIWQQSIDSSGRFTLQEGASEGGTKYTRLQIDDTGEATFSGSVSATAINLNGEETNTDPLKIKFDHGEGTSDAGLSSVSQTEGVSLALGSNAFYNASGGIVASDSNNQSMAITVDGFSSNKIKFLTAATGNPVERASIDDSGLSVSGSVTSTGLTVSTTYPKLQLNSTSGVARNFSVGTNNETFTIRNETASSDSLTISNANIVNIPQSLMVGSTTAPSAKLEVQGGTTYPAMKLSRDGGSAGTQGYTTYGHSAIGYSGGTGADTYIVSEHGFGFAVNAGTNALTITDTVRVGIGLDNPSRNLTVHGGAGYSILALQNDSTGSAAGDGFQIQLVGTDIYQFNYDTGFMLFGTGGQEAMRIDASRNLLVGKTSLGIGVTGTEVRANGQLLVTADADNPADFNRKTSDGDIALFRKDGTTVGSIGTQGGDLNIGTGACGIQFVDGVPALYPWTTTGNTTRDAAIDLGDSGARFKDLYLSGGLRGDTTFKNNAGTTEYARFDSSNNLLVGTTGANTYSSTVNTGVQIAPDFIGVARNQNTVMHLNRQGNDGTIVDFRTFGFVRGSVSISGSTTSYNTSSDERLKDNIIDAPIASEDIDAIQVRSFDWKADGEHQKYGMVAQELLEVAPDAVTQGDTPDDMMGVDYSKLVPMLIKEIQSLRQRVAQLEE